MSSRIIRGKRFLITQSTLHWVAGAEIQTLELAEYLQAQGAQVSVFTYFFEKPVKNFFDDKRIEVITDETKLDVNNFDYIWVNHQTLPRSIIKGLAEVKKMPVFMYNHMSPFESLPIERPFIWGIEEKTASVVLFNSEETRRAQQKLLSDEVMKVVFPNPAPEQFVRADIQPNDTAGNVLIVSSHAPAEVYEAKGVLEANGVSVEVLSGYQSSPRIIDANYLSGFDVVVSIGKTVQYCLCAGVPVYVYDHFGGPGFLNEDNFTVSSDLNFSGRGFEKKNGTEIAKEIIDNYRDALYFQQRNHSTLKDSYSIGVLLPRLLKSVVPVKKPHFDNNYVQYLLTAYEKNKLDLQNYHKTIGEVRKNNYERDSLLSEIKALAQEISILKSSKIWRVRDLLVKVKRLLLRSETNRGISVIVPVYADRESLQRCILSLKKHAPRLCRIILANDCGPEADELEAMIKELTRGDRRFRYYRNKKNLGFIKNCNQAVRYARKADEILLLNSDAEVTEGAIEEMQKALYRANNIASISPRSNNATVFSIPFDHNTETTEVPEKSYKIYKKVKYLLPEVYETPTTHGFCMLIRRSVIRKYGLFDEIFGVGYGEENDFCMRVRRHGYTHAIANRAYVFHEGSKSFTDKVRRERSEKSMKLILERYPSYVELIEKYIEHAVIPEQEIIANLIQSEA